MEGEVRLALYVGLVRDNWAEARREADYLKSTGTDTLVFGYTVESDDTDIRGVGQWQTRGLFPIRGPRVRHEQRR